MSISVKHVSKRFGPKIVLDELSVEFQNRQVSALIGPSGSGKSVLSKIIGGLIPFDTGTIEVDGEVFENSKVERQVFSVSYVFQFGGLFDSLTIFENVIFPRRMKRGFSKKDLLEAYELCENLNLLPFVDLYPKDVPLSVRKLCAFARALLTESEWVFVDEPDSGLDCEGIMKLYSVIRSFRNQRSIVIVSHDVPAVFEVCDFYALIYGGKIVSFGEILNGRVAKIDPYIVQFMEGSIDGPIRL
ncbi:MAG: ATP-binding cassette domain-containing protein, partial [Deltaproteobacteria bacterium]|nr:ATP-binding cassette domain-containing protein [Deltaproteobacteria bacterium]